MQSQNISKIQKKANVRHSKNMRDQAPSCTDVSVQASSVPSESTSAVSEVLSSKNWIPSHPTPRYRYSIYPQNGMRGSQILPYITISKMARLKHRLMRSTNKVSDSALESAFLTTFPGDTDAAGGGPLLENHHPRNILTLNTKKIEARRSLQHLWKQPSIIWKMGKKKKKRQQTPI